jgi:hypothetical protein
VETRVINGFTTGPGAIPWQVCLRERRTKMHFCGATLVSTMFAITAAHCIEKRSSHYGISVGHTKRGNLKIFFWVKKIKTPKFNLKNTGKGPNWAAKYRRNEPTQLHDFLRKLFVCPNRQKSKYPRNFEFLLQMS